MARERHPDLVIHRYDHGGGRIYFDRDGKRDLIVDLYADENDSGARRDRIIEMLLGSGILDSD